ncbi:MAG: glutathione transferase GstA [Steroidobacteraceae bacterium]
MKLYFSPGSCALAAHIVAQEAGIPVVLVQVDLRKKQTADGSDFLAINPKGYVPALELDDGQILTEASAVLQYLADRNPASSLAPANGTLDRYRVQEWLGYINSEIHKTCGPLFNPMISAEQRQERIDYLNRRLPLVDKALAGSAFLTGDTFTVADAYLFVVSNWAKRLTLDLSAFPNLLAFQQRVAARPAVVAAMRAEGLIK